MSTLYDQIEEEEKNLNELEEAESNESSEVTEEESIDKPEELEAEPDDEADVEEEVEQNEEQEASESEQEDNEDNLVSNPDFARLRREKRALEKKLREIEAGRNNIAQANEQEQDAPSQDEIVQQMYQDKQRQDMINDAVAEFQSYEQEFAATVNDYEDVTTQYVNHVARSIQTLNPQIKGHELNDAVRMQILQQAGRYVTQGLDPAEEMYHTAKQLFPTQEQAAEQEQPVKRDIKKVAENRKKSASPLAGRSKSKSQTLTLDEVAQMSPAEYQKVDPQLLRELEKQAGIS